jgi:hypothetical protein
MNSAELIALMEPIARHFFGQPNARLSNTKELRWGTNGSLSVDLVKGVWYDHENQIGGNAIDLIMRQERLKSATEAHQWAEDNGYAQPNGRGNSNGPGQQGWNEIAHHDYTDETDEFLFQVVKFEPKRFVQRVRDPAAPHGWSYSLKGVRRVVYKLPALLEALANEQRVFVVEGEKDVESCWARGIPATCNPGGAGKWREEYNNTFKDADVVIIADNDTPGRAHAEQVAAHLRKVAARVRVLDLAQHWPQCPDKGDVTDYFAAGHTVEQLNEIVEKLPDWTPQQPATPLATIDAFPIDEAAISLRPWLIPGLLLRQHVTVLVAPSASGKSLLSVPISIACALNMPWANWRPRQRCRVLIVNAEDDRDEMQRRLCAAAQRMDANHAELAGYIKLADNPSNVVIANYDTKTKTLVRTPLMAELIDTIKAQAIDVLMVDPFAETFQGDENSNSELKWVAMLWREIARTSNIAVLLNHHTKKYATGMQGDMDAARGGGSLIGIARIVSTLFPMTAEEAELMEITAENRIKYIRYDDAKANLNLITGQARWFFKDTYTIANATAEFPGDDVGVLVPWKPPGVLDNISIATINALLDEIDRGYVDDNGDPTGEAFGPSNNSREGTKSRWVGLVIQTWLQCTKERAAEIVKLWLKNGTLVEIETTVGRHKRKGVQSDRSKRPGRETDRAEL